MTIKVTKQAVFNLLNDQCKKVEWKGFSEQPKGNVEGVEWMRHMWVSKINDGYLCFDAPWDKNHKDQLDAVVMLLKNGITEQLQSTKHGGTVQIGFNPTEEKWYGWSHRALFGFGVGDSVKRGNCAYVPKNEIDFALTRLAFWEDVDKRGLQYEITERFNEETGLNERGVLVKWVYTEDTTNEKMRGQISSVFTPFPTKFGRGEWTAETLDDAKQMAIDFARGVS